MKNMMMGLFLLLMSIWSDIHAISEGSPALHGISLLLLCPGIGFFLFGFFKKD